MDKIDKKDVSKTLTTKTEGEEKLAPKVDVSNENANDNSKRKNDKTQDEIQMRYEENVFQKIQITSLV